MSFDLEHEDRIGLDHNHQYSGFWERTLLRPSEKVYFLVMTQCLMSLIIGTCDQSSNRCNDEVSECTRPDTEARCPHSLGLT